MSDRKNHSIRIFALVLCCFAALTLAGCSAVFKAGVSGKVVDAESTSTPKAGVSNVQVYAYTKEADRNSDYNAYVANPNGRFYPSRSSYIGQTTTGNDGAFVVNKLVWESMSPEFGKTADYSRLYLLFYHDDYGLYKNTGDVVVVSDSNNADTVYEELTKIRKTTTINLTIRDVATRNPLNSDVNVIVKVPQSTSNTLEYIEYEETITGTGTISVTYPRYVDPSVTPKVEFEPTVLVSLEQASAEPTWKQAYNNESHGEPAVIDYAFYADGEVLKQKIKGTSFSMNAYMKSTKLSYPAIKSRVELDGNVAGSKDKGKVEDDDLLVWFGYKNSSNQLELFADVSASVTTASQGDGANNSVIEHGHFSGLGEGMTWDDDSYTEKYLSKPVYVIVDANNNGNPDGGDYYIPVVVRSDEAIKEIRILRPSTLTPPESLVEIIGWPVSL